MADYAAPEVRGAIMVVVGRALADLEMKVMATYTFTVEDAPRSADVEVLSQGLTTHALPYTQIPGFHPLGVFMRDEHGGASGRRAGVW